MMTTYCPKCGKRTLLEPPYESWNSLSRVDNETYICSDCGTLETFEQLTYGQPAPKSSWVLPQLAAGTNL